MAEPPEGPRRERAPTITLDTSAVSLPPSTEQSYALETLPADHHDPARTGSTAEAVDSRPTSPHNVSALTKNHDYLAVPGDRSRNNSMTSDSASPTQTSFGGETMVPSPNGSPPKEASKDNHANVIMDDEEALKPDPGTEASFEVENNPFFVSPGELGKMYNPKSLSAFHALRGLRGLEIGLRTDRRAGLSTDEAHLDGQVTMAEVKERVHMLSQANGTVDSHAKLSEADIAPVPTSASAPANAFADRKRVFKENRLPEKKTKSFLQLAWIAYKDKVLILLTVAAVISLAVGLYQTFGQVHDPGEASVEWVEGVAIMVAVLIVVVVGALNDWQKERQFVKLNRRKEDRTVKVIRSGRSQEISVYDLMVGDVMHLEPGDLVPVDGVLIEGHGIKCDESSATGESDLIKKQPADDVYRAIDAQQDVRKMDPFILSGAKVTEGVGTFLVTAVGIHSVYGKTLTSLREEMEATPLQVKLNKLAEQIAKLGGASALLLFVVLFIKFLAQLRGNTDSASEKGQAFLRILIVAITVVVVAVPEGLPLAVTLALAFATTRMLKDNNLVRVLRACETMGNATTVCSDKTGTLTQNKMTVVAGLVGMTCRFDDRGTVAQDAAASPTKTDKAAFDDSVEDVSARELVTSLSEDVRAAWLQSIVINSTAFEGEEDGKPTFIGSKTETALLLFARDHLGMQSVSVERDNAQVAQFVPFDSGRKCMGTVVKLPNGRFRMHVKGASEILLGKSTKMVAQPTTGMDETMMTSENIETVNHMIETYASRSLRTIGMVYRDYERWPPEGAKTNEDDPTQADFNDVFRDMVFLGLVGIQDPLRPGVSEAVRQCQRAGVFVRMVTGDNVITARAIAEECGIFTPGGVIMEGPKFRKLNRVQMDRAIPRLQVLARSSPEDKRTLVKRLKELGETVAVTGDGTNDAPALKTADVGFSMGIAGTEVAKEASAIILMDDNFTSIVKAIMWGRAVNDAVRKFLQFQLTVNITAVLLTFVSAVSNENEEAVLKAVQLLWVNLIMDTLAALALATDPPALSVLDRKPDRKSAALITVTMWKMIIGQAIFQLVVTFVLYFAGNRIFSYDTPEERETLNTLVFNTFVWMQIFNQINNRRLDNKFNIFEGIFRNRFFLVVNLVMVGGQVLIIFVGDQALQVVPLDGAQWATSIVLGAMSLPIGMVIRLIPDGLLRRLIPSRLHRRKTPQVVVTDEDHRFEWNQALEGIREELFFLKRLRGGRLNAIKFKLQHPRGSLMHRPRSDSRSRSSSIPQTPTGDSGGTEFPAPPSAAHTPESRTRRRTRSRSNSAFGPAAAMAGVVAGSIAGWSPINRAHSIGSGGEGEEGDRTNISTAFTPEAGRADLEAQEGIVVHPGTDPSDPVVTDQPTRPGEGGEIIPPSQMAGTAPSFEPAGDSAHQAGRTYDKS